MAAPMTLSREEIIRRTLYRTDSTSLGRIHQAYRETLTVEDTEHYALSGYLAMEGVLDAAEIDACKVALSDLITQRTPWDEHVRIHQEPYYVDGQVDERVTDPELKVRKVWMFSHVEPRLGAIARHPKILAVVDQLVGSGNRMIQDMALIKPPFHGSEKPWHQDTAYFDYTPLGGIIGVWIALDEATVGNGCMQVIPSTHLGGPVPHFHERDCQIGDNAVGVDRAVVVPLKPGGALFFSGLLHHGTPPNLSGDRRRALQYHYAAANCRSMTFAEHAELFDVGGAYAGCRSIDEHSGKRQAVYEP
jgi:phytanoyl-CoA hydroxylase